MKFILVHLYLIKGRKMDKQVRATKERDLQGEAEGDFTDPDWLMPSPVGGVCTTKNCW